MGFRMLMGFDTTLMGYASIFMRGDEYGITPHAEYLS